MPACRNLFGQEDFGNCRYTIPRQLYNMLSIDVPLTAVVEAVAIKYETTTGLTAVIQGCTNMMDGPPAPRQRFVVFDGLLNESTNLVQVPAYIYEPDQGDIIPIEPKSGLLTILPMHQVGVTGNGTFLWGSTNQFGVDYGGPAVKNAITIFYVGPNSRPSYPTCLNLCGDHLVFSPGV
jgi:hypothetical protein